MSNQSFNQPNPKLTKDPTELTKIEIFNHPIEVSIDLPYAIEICQNLDKLLPDEHRLPITGKAAVMILAEYGAIAHRCSSAPEGIKLAVVICHPTVWFCPSHQGLDGVFIEPYQESKHGQGICLEHENGDLFRYGSIEARLDGWEFAARMIKHDRAAAAPTN
jgi:hypothetical protein